jgi:ribosome-associated heat shock protein Hsp15
LDKWLWAARFFKTRKLAQDAIAGGKVHVNDQRAKPGKEIKIGAVLAISKETYRWLITVTAISNQRRPAPEAALLYDESQESKLKREQQLQLQREHKELYPFDGKSERPNKKQRRMIHSFLQK